MMRYSEINKNTSNTKNHETMMDSESPYYPIFKCTSTQKKPIPKQRTVCQNHYYHNQHQQHEQNQQRPHHHTQQPQEQQQLQLQQLPIEHYQNNHHRQQTIEQLRPYHPRPQQHHQQQQNLTHIIHGGDYVDGDGYDDDVDDDVGIDDVDDDKIIPLLRNSIESSSFRALSCLSSSNDNGMPWRNDSVRSTHSYNWDNERLSKIDNSTGKSNSKANRRKNSIGCLNVHSTSPDSNDCYNYKDNSLSSMPIKSQTLPSPLIKPLKNTVNVLDIPPNELANQMTFLDFQLFTKIQPGELKKSAWNKKDKAKNAKNVVKFTNRFNQVIYLVTNEILNNQTPKRRADVCIHFIKVAKKLQDLNNLQSLFAVVSALQSAPIHRLTQTWSLLSKKDSLLFDTLGDIFDHKNNFDNLRKYMETLNLPIIPYLGKFQADLEHLDAWSQGYPDKRDKKREEILRKIAEYQKSDYTHIKPNLATQQYLESTHYFDELKGILENNLFEKSQDLEPNIPSVPKSSSSSSSSCNTDFVSTNGFNGTHVSPAKSNGHGTRSVTKCRGHRKTKSLEKNVLHDHNHPCIHNLTTNCQICHSSNESITSRLNSTDDTISINEFYVQRQTLRKAGYPKKVKLWKAYWIEVTNNSLIYYEPKFGLYHGTKRGDFKSESDKECKLNTGWRIQNIKDTKFDLWHEEDDTIYRFRTDNQQKTETLINLLHMASETLRIIGFD